MKIVGYLSTIIIAILFTFSAQAEEIKDNSSDRRLMTNIVELEVLENGMVIYDWVWNDAARVLDPKYGMPVEEGGYPSQGLIAQEIESEYPDAVIEDSYGYLVIDIPVLADNDALIAQMVMEGGADVVKKKKWKKRKCIKFWWCWKKKKKKKKKKKRSVKKQCTNYFAPIAAAGVGLKCSGEENKNGKAETAVLLVFAQTQAAWFIAHPDKIGDTAKMQSRLVRKLGKICTNDTGGGRKYTNADAFIVMNTICRGY